MFFQLEEGIQHLALVVSPLLSIIYQQVRQLQGAGIKAHAITSESEPADIEGNAFPNILHILIFN